MNAKDIMKIFEETAYVRMGGTDSELRCAKYLADCCERIGLKATIEEFDVPMATMQEAVFEADPDGFEDFAVFFEVVRCYSRFSLPYQKK